MAGDVASKETGWGHFSSTNLHNFHLQNWPPLSLVSSTFLIENSLFLLDSKTQFLYILIFFKVFHFLIFWCITVSLKFNLNRVLSFLYTHSIFVPSRALTHSRSTMATRFRTMKSGVLGKSRAFLSSLCMEAMNRQPFR